MFMKCFFALYLFIIASSISACFSGSDVTHDKLIKKEILGNRITSLYETFGFLKLEIDGEYADLQEGEHYWIAIDAGYEYLTLRTVKNIVVEIIITNPDLKNMRGIAVGATQSEFLNAYPDATKLTTYQNGINRQLSAYCVESEKLEVEFYEGKIFSQRILNQCR